MNAAALPPSQGTHSFNYSSQSTRHDSGFPQLQTPAYPHDQDHYLTSDHGSYFQQISQPTTTMHQLPQPRQEDDEFVYLPPGIPGSINCRHCGLVLPQSKQKRSTANSSFNYSFPSSVTTSISSSWANIQPAQSSSISSFSNAWNQPQQFQQSTEPYQHYQQQQQQACNQFNSSGFYSHQPTNNQGTMGNSLHSYGHQQAQGMWQQQPQQMMQFPQQQQQLHFEDPNDEFSSSSCNSSLEDSRFAKYARNF